ncbi:MAG: peptide chain release factor N(5)-glutamine methyltransferase [Bacilli bacterium]
MIPTKKDLELLKEKYRDNLENIMEQINNDYPIQYLIGDVNFYGYPIKVTESVLIPRFETEQLIEKTLDLIKQTNIMPTSILDIGTGSGCIAITIKKKIDKANVTAIDISSKALEVASSNAILNNVDIKFVKKDILQSKIDELYDIIISNPPYLCEEDEVSKEIFYEPQNALYADNKGLIFYENIISKSVGHLKKPGILAFETGINQHKEIIKYIKDNYPNGKIINAKDYQNKDRFIFLINE